MITLAVSGLQVRTSHLSARSGTHYSADQLERGALERGG
jgi:hypothetical protein